ncbi:MAG: YciI family protein [Chloroflexota bacterium]|nr:YciI family protein [Chloroflexota bacterium]
MAQFMLLIRGGDEGIEGYTPEQFQQMIQRYFDWSDQLRREGRYVGGDELKAGGNVVRRRGGQAVVDGPYAETKEAVGGYYLIEARDAAEAAEVAKGCPVLVDGGVVEVREINPNP